MVRPDPPHNADICPICNANWPAGQWSPTCPSCDEKLSENLPGEITQEQDLTEEAKSVCKFCGGPLEFDRELYDVCCVCADQIRQETDWGDEESFRVEFLKRRPPQMSSTTFWFLAGGLTLLTLYLVWEIVG